MSKQGVEAILSIPVRRQLAIGTLRQIVRISGLTDKEHCGFFDSHWAPPVAAGSAPNRIMAVTVIPPSFTS